MCFGKRWVFSHSLEELQPVRANSFNYLDARTEKSLFMTSFYLVGWWVQQGQAEAPR